MHQAHASQLFIFFSSLKELDQYKRDAAKSWKGLELES